MVAEAGGRLDVPAVKKFDSNIITPVSASSVPLSFPLLLRLRAHAGALEALNQVIWVESRRRAPARARWMAAWPAAARASARAFSELAPVPLLN